VEWIDLAQDTNRLEGSGDRGNKASNSIKLRKFLD